MTAARSIEETGKGLGDAHGPVSGRGRRRQRHGGARRGLGGQSSGDTSRRDAVLRVLMEAYRRDVGPGAFDPR